MRYVGFRDCGLGLRIGSLEVSIWGCSVLSSSRTDEGRSERWHLGFMVQINVAMAPLTI